MDGIHQVLRGAASSASLQAPSQDSRPYTRQTPLSSIPRLSVYTRKKPNQLQRLATPRSRPVAQAEPQTPESSSIKSSANLSGSAKTLSESVPHGSSKQSPGLLFHKGRHSLVRRSSGSILSAVARTVAAVHSHSALKASKKWSRTSEGRSSSAPHKIIPHAPIPSNQRPALARPTIGARFAGRKEAYQWQRGQSGQSPASGTRPAQARAHRLASAARAKPRQKAYQQWQSRAAGNVGPAKLVRVEGVLYRVSGIGKGRSLKRQVTPKPLPRSSLTEQVHGSQYILTHLLIDRSSAEISVQLAACL